MFSLAIYDKLTPGALTGGANIAGTGTINYTGAVGPIGGIQQKLAGAKRGGAAWFLAPAANCDEVVGHIPDGLQVFKVATFAQARDTVEAIAAKRTASLPKCT
jgi:PDZ domain-containing protein